MSYLNVWVGVPDDKLDAWDGPAPTDAGDTDVNPRTNWTTHGLYRKDTNAGQEWTLRTVYVENSPGWQGRLLQGFPTLRLLGAWEQDGTRVIPLHPRVLEYMPDDVVFNEDRSEASRTRPTEPKDVNLGMGWSPRNWE